MQSDESEKLGRYQRRVHDLKRTIRQIEWTKGKVGSPWWAVFARAAAGLLWLCGMALHLPGLLLLTLSDELRASVHLSRHKRGLWGSGREY